MAAAEDVVTESNGGVSTGGGDDDATARAATIAMMTADGAAPLMDNVGAFADEEWLARALAAASSAGLVGDADAVASDLAALSFAHEMEEDAKNQRAPDDAAKLRVAPSPVEVGAAGGWTSWEGGRTLLVDNYDSYTFNLYHLIAAVEGVPPVVIRNDHFKTSSSSPAADGDEDDDAGWAQLAPAIASRHFTRVVLSPGPGTPDRPEDVGICTALLKHAVDTPILGVCLGHQALAAAHGGEVTRAPAPMHGRLHTLEHDGSGLFEDIPSGGARDAGGKQFTVVRYHSLVVDATSLPECLEATVGGLSLPGVRFFTWTIPAVID
jgi:para-aminobenzoate synthetase